MRTPRSWCELAVRSRTQTCLCRARPPRPSARAGRLVGDASEAEGWQRRRTVSVIGCLKKEKTLSRTRLHGIPMEFRSAILRPRCTAPQSALSRFSTGLPPSEARAQMCALPTSCDGVNPPQLVLGARAKRARHPPPPSTWSPMCPRIPSSWRGRLCPPRRARPLACSSLSSIRINACATFSTCAPRHQNRERSWRAPPRSHSTGVSRPSCSCSGAPQSF